MQLPARFSGFTCAGVALLLVASVFVAPAPVRASCGNYLHRLAADMPADAQHHTPMAHEKHTAQPGPCPCQGPNCSGRSQPVAPPPAVSVTIERDYAVCLVASCPPVPDGTVLDRTSRRVRSVHLFSGIFHPPRSHDVYSA